MVSRFLFDGLVFDAAYFRQKMAESRRQRRDLRERVRQMLAGSRSGPVSPAAAELDAVPGLLEALNGLTTDLPETFTITGRGGFDLKRYQGHVQAHVQPIGIGFDEIPPLSKDLRIDRIWRFIAIIFLAQAGAVNLRQDGPTIWVTHHETDGKRQDISGEPESADGIEGSVRGIQAG